MKSSIALITGNECITFGAPSLKTYVIMACAKAMGAQFGLAMGWHVPLRLKWLEKHSRRTNRPRQLVLYQNEITERKIKIQPRLRMDKGLKPA